MTGQLTGLLARQVRQVDVDFGVRGFPACPAAVRSHLESRAHAFVAGAHAFGAHPDNPHEALAAALDEDLRGFGYEGAGMVAAMADLAALGRGPHLRRLLGGQGVGYRHLVHVGAGWGLSVARLPRPTVLRQLDPLLRWLALDGRGFHRHYFSPERTLDELHGLADTPATQIHAAGVGRALWFTHGADLPRIAVDIALGPARLQPSMWSGVGLASCYAGRPDDLDVEELRSLAQPFAAHVGQGILFALAARDAHGLPVDPDRRSLAGRFGVPADRAAELADYTSSDLARPGAGAAAMQLWRTRLVAACQRGELEQAAAERTRDA